MTASGQHWISTVSAALHQLCEIDPAVSQDPLQWFQKTFCLIVSVLKKHNLHCHTSIALSENASHPQMKKAAAHPSCLDQVEQTCDKQMEEDGMLRNELKVCHNFCSHCKFQFFFVQPAGLVLSFCSLTI